MGLGIDSGRLCGGFADPSAGYRHDKCCCADIRLSAISGRPALLLVFAAVGLAPLAGWLAYSEFDHVRLRVDKFMQGGSLQTERSIQSFSEGGWFGVGPGDGTVKHYLPDAHADFIFSVAAEEYGLLACLFLIGVYSFIVIRGYAQSLGRQDLFTILAVTGLTTQFGVQAAIHMASSVDMIPTKGMTLPLISYGGSSLMASGLTLGLILALTRKTQQSSPSYQPMARGRYDGHFNTAQKRLHLACAGGTGGHVFPALHTADVLTSRGFDVVMITDKRGAPLPLRDWSELLLQPPHLLLARCHAAYLPLSNCLPALFKYCRF